MRVIYVCPRCSFETHIISTMQNHFKRKTTCCNVNGIELTEEIKSYALRFPNKEMMTAYIAEQRAKQESEQHNLSVVHTGSDMLMITEQLGILDKYTNWFEAEAAGQFINKETWSDIVHEKIKGHVHRYNSFDFFGESSNSLYPHLSPSSIIKLIEKTFCSINDGEALTYSTYLLKTPLLYDTENEKLYVFSEKKDKTKYWKVISLSNFVYNIDVSFSPLFLAYETYLIHACFVSSNNSFCKENAWLRLRDLFTFTSCFRSKPFTCRPINSQLLERSYDEMKGSDIKAYGDSILQDVNALFMQVYNDDTKVDYHSLVKKILRTRLIKASKQLNHQIVKKLAEDRVFYDKMTNIAKEKVEMIKENENAETSFLKEPGFFVIKRNQETTRPIFKRDDPDEEKMNFLPLF